MIHITICEDPDGYIYSFSATGHAGYADAGSDIICAAVTALATTAIGSLQELAGFDPDHVLEDGCIEMTLPAQTGLSEQQRQTVMVLMNSLVIGCRQIKASYGKRYIRIRTETKCGRKNL